MTAGRIGLRAHVEPRLGEALRAARVEVAAAYNALPPAAQARVALLGEAAIARAILAGDAAMAGREIARWRSAQLAAIHEAAQAAEAGGGACSEHPAHPEAVVE